MSRRTSKPQVIRLDIAVRNPHSGGCESERLLPIGNTDGGRPLTLVIERTVDPTAWLIVTGWTATERERRIIS